MRQIAAGLAFDGYKWIKKPLIRLDDSGKIIDVGRFYPHKTEPAQTEYYNGILTPGFINAHLHLELSVSNSVFTDRSGMADFVQHVRNCRKQLAQPEDTDIKIQLRKIRNTGTVALVDVTNTGLISEILNDSALKTIIFFEYYLPNPGKLQQQKKAFCDIIRKYPDCPIFPALHSPYIITDSNVNVLNKIFSKPVKITSVHFMESRGEEKLYENSGRLYDLYRKLDDQYMPFVNRKSLIRDVFESFSGAEKILFVHNTFISSEDIESIEYLTHETNKKIGFVLCPRSNYNISGVEPPYEELRKSGFPVMLGTDSLLSVSSLSIFDELRFVHHRRPDIPPEELLKWITLNPARFFAMEDTMGSLEPGKKPGINLIHGMGVGTEHWPEGTEIKVLV
jgi:aminodeoxyfutalosine deaminase